MIKKWLKSMKSWILEKESGSHLIKMAPMSLKLGSNVREKKYFGENTDLYIQFYHAFIFLGTGFLFFRTFCTLGRRWWPDHPEP